MQSKKNISLIKIHSNPTESKFLQGTTVKAKPRAAVEGAMPGCHGVAELGKRAQEMDSLTQQTADQDAGQLGAEELAVN